MKLWVAYKALNDGQHATAIPVLLKNSALIFYQGLPDSTNQDFAIFEAAFLQRFMLDGNLSWANNLKLWECKQLPDQSVDNYLNEIVKLK